MRSLPNPASPRDPLGEVLAGYRGSLVWVGLFSGVMNVIMLAGSIYMLQVYDRVLASRSVPTLVGLTAMLLVVFLVQGLLDVVRQRILTRIGAAIDRRLAPRIFDLMVLIPVRAGLRQDALQPGRDLDAVRGFMSGLGPTTFFDLPWVPIFLLLCFLLHVWIGLTALVACVVLLAVTLLTDRATKEPTAIVSREAAARSGIAEGVKRNAETIVAMGMQKALVRRYQTTNGRFLEANEAASDVVTTYGAVSRIFRMFMQSAMLGLGAYLVILGQVSGGVMIAASILMGRALAPIELAVAHWKGFVAARQALARLRKTMAALGDGAEPMALPAPKRMLTVDQVFAAAPGAQEPIIQGISFSLLAGQALGIIGPSASGKSTLARVLTGSWLPLRGSLRLDGAELSQWSADARGGFIGYLAQDIGLFDGTVAENIARFQPDADPQAIVEAARATGADDVIRKLPAGYETRIGEGGIALSGGQRQRVALARALYGNPFLVVLDEPNANLDAEGEAAVTQAIRHIRDSGGIAIVVAHRPSAITAVDMVAVMKDGRVAAFGPKDEVLNKVLAPAKGTRSP
ncbi:type I secretion system permease/ATPase [Phreatobacter stygius]|uniref:Type I secretion system permease/ATPase n=1 Tax=Phreatobacter stygius TaxID=1940610 RepID=A0A4D7AQM5_9HYPH|nr:type I secretion system permease/ATPase [Phreatobacter stygius]QCI63584.1 type I secretion system permease/ATPase [Phreatobacter stygius]